MAYLIQYVGFVSTFNLVYVLVNELFPTIFLATAFGCVNIIGRAVAVTSPLVARVRAPYPMAILAVWSGICAFIPLVLVKIKKTGNQQK